MFFSRVRYLQGVFTPSGGAPPGVSTDTNTVTVPTIVSVSLPTAATEVSYVLPAGTKTFLLKTETLNARLQLSYTSGQSGTLYLTIPYSANYTVSGLDAGASITLYVQSNKASTAVEIVSWA